jgi:hypothetical protein
MIAFCRFYQLSERLRLCLADPRYLELRPGEPLSGSLQILVCTLAKQFSFQGIHPSDTGWIKR